MATPTRRTPKDMRVYVDSVLAGWDVPGTVRDAMKLITSELTTNAVIHTHSRITVSLQLSGGEAIVRVADHGLGCHLSARHPALASERGRGLLIVETVASRWEQHETPGGGTTVEAAIALPGRQLASTQTAEDACDAPRAHP